MSTTTPGTGPVPRLGPDVEPADFCRAWAASPALADLVAGFDGKLPDPAVPAADAWTWLADFSARWDYRKRRERNQAAMPDFDAPTTALVDRTTRALGLQDTLPPVRTHYDHVLILGGLARGCIARSLHAAAMLADGTITADRVTALSAFRPLTAEEAPLLRTMGLTRAETEFDVMVPGVQRAFGLGEPREVAGARGVDGGWTWRLESYRGDGDLPVDVLAAESPEVGRRANTGETYTWLAASRRIFAPGQSVLIVTTFHYRLYQLADAIRLLGIPYGVALDGVGIVPGQLDPRLAWMPSTGDLLQEMRSTIRSLRALQAALPAA